MSELAGLIQAVLFAAGDLLTTEQLALATGRPESDCAVALLELSNQLGTTGLRLQEYRGQWQLVTAPVTADAVKRYLTAETKPELSKAALETLAMIAYRGPVARAELDELRGVSSDSMIRNLLQRGLITPQGKSEEPGHPVLYGVSHRFLQHVGLTSLAELPPLTEGSVDEAE